MIGISKLYCGTVEPSDALRYGRMSGKLPSHLLQFSKDKRPVVVWNITRRCNLKCVHCYAHAKDRPFENELTTEKGKALMDDLADFGVPVLLFSGGEPLVRKDLPELAAYAVEKGMRAVISTNGTLITTGHGSDPKIYRAVLCGYQPGWDGEYQRSFQGVKGAFDGPWKGSKTARLPASRSDCGLPSTINAG